MMMSQNTMAATSAVSTSAVSIMILNAHARVSTYQIKEALEEGDEYLRHSQTIAIC